MRRAARSSTLVFSAVAVISMIVATIGAMLPTSTAFACPVIPNGGPACPTYAFPYAHSWYVTNPSELGGKLAQGDASYVNTNCANNANATDYLTVLNFGRPGLYNGAYAQYDHGGIWLTNSQVESDAEAYINTWYADTSSCPRLHLVIGTANDYECYNGTYNSACNVYTAGQNWALVTYDVQNYVSAHGYAWQITVWSGDDLEAEWDQWTSSSCQANPKTVDFLNGFNDKDSSLSTHSDLIDYGDADYGSATLQCGTWSQQNVYQAAWGMTYDWPLPETYTSYLTQRWVNVLNSQGYMGFQGNMAECSEADILANNTCWVARDNQCEWSPFLGYSNLSSDVNQTSIPYSTNIQWPDDTHSSNNGCA